jgi:hypothetical protein
VRVVIVEPVHEHAVVENRVSQRERARRRDEARAAAFVQRVETAQYAVREIVLRGREGDAYGVEREELRPLTGRLRDVFVAIA